MKPTIKLLLPDSITPASTPAPAPNSPALPALPASPAPAHHQMDDASGKFGDLVDVVGPIAAQRIFNRYSGRTLMVPSDPDGTDTVLAMMMSREAYRALVIEFAAETISIPTAYTINRHQRNRDIYSARANGASTKQLVEKFGLSQRAITYILQGYL